MSDRRPAAKQRGGVDDLRSRLAGVSLVDERRLGRRLSDTRRIREPAAREHALAKIAQAINAAEALVARRRAAVGTIEYPDELPVSQRRDEIAELIRDHQVVVLAGETGSGKTTQLPKICLELGRGVRGRIGHTQPRRIAARSVAERVAEELGSAVGGAVGYQVRFTDQVSPETVVKVMTDGILLAEIQHDRDLLAYDTIIIDEAHERSLTIDFLLGYLHQLLPRRPDLKVVITSATIEPERFSEHFGGAPIIEVSGRTYPVEIRYRPLVPDAATHGGRPDDAESGQVGAVCTAINELITEGPGDILVFLSGEREIGDTKDAIDGMRLPHTETLPLYGRLSAAEQHRVFAPHPGRRVVLATNVAETSLTVPGIRYVVDAGTARISRYSNRTKVQRLPIEPISQASAKQRAGRCGRVADGICVRLYSQDDHDGRPAYTDPEIQRTSLAAVILQMAALGLGDVEAFPFLDPPDRRQVRDGVALLTELGALASGRAETPRLTGVGRQLARLPIDPRLGRMIIAADARQCVREVIVITAALSIQDPRERPQEHRARADQMHARFADDHSDFTSILNLWAYVREQQRDLSSSAFRRMCVREHLHYLRIREWQDVVAQLKQACAAVGISVTSSPEDDEGIHRAVLAGLLSHLGARDERRREYAGARGARFAVNPGSSLFRRQPDWIMAAELVETTRLWARVCARIEPEWAEEAAGDLVDRQYSEPRWSARRGSVVANERVTLFGLPLVTDRVVQYGRIDPALARELFIRHALVEGEWQTRHRFFHENRRLVAELEELEHRTRRRDLLADDAAAYAFYDARIPATVVSARHFDSWWKRTRHATPDLLTLTRDLLAADAAAVSEDDYPSVWRSGPDELALTYHFEPGADDDGVTVHVPVAVLGRVPAGGLEPSVPGLRLELVTALLRTLPKPIRTRIVPIPDTARAIVHELDPASADPLTDQLAWHLHRRYGVLVARDDWDRDRLPAHLRPTYVVEGPDGAPLAQGKDLQALQRELRVQVSRAVARVGADLEQDDVRPWADEWPVTAIPRQVDGTVDGHDVRGFPAFVVEGGRVAVRVLPTAAEQAVEMQAGTRALLTVLLPPAARVASRVLDNTAKLALAHNPDGSVPALFDDCAGCTVDAIVADEGGPAWDAAGFARLQHAVRRRGDDVLADVLRRVAPILGRAHDIATSARALASPVLARSVGDVEQHLAALLPPGFAVRTGLAGLPDLDRYLRALQLRVAALPGEPARDRAAVDRVAAVQAEVDATLGVLPPARAAAPEAAHVRAMLEEFRVSLFAQRVGTKFPVSEQRIWKALDRLTAG